MTLRMCPPATPKNPRFGPESRAQGDNQGDTFSEQRDTGGHIGGTQIARFRAQGDTRGTHPGDNFTPIGTAGGHPQQRIAADCPRVPHPDLSGHQIETDPAPLLTHAETVTYAQGQLAAATHKDARAVWAFLLDELWPSCSSARARSPSKSR